MANINIPFNNKNYSVDETFLSTASSALRTHFSTTMSGSGATISLGGTSYNVDSAKLSTARNAFVSHLDTVAGNGYKVVVNGVEYNVDSAKMAGAVSELEAVLGGLNGGGGNGGAGESCTPIFGATYIHIEGVTKSSYVFYEDGSIKYYVSDSLVQELPVGTLAYSENKIYMGSVADENVMATVSMDRTQIVLDMYGEVNVFILDDTTIPA